MSKALSNVMSRLRSLAGLHEAGQLSDCELLECFLQKHDETAFTAIVERHGPMVLKVCRRVLHHHQDAEDACQATFLILVRRASAIRKLNSLSSWLHGVACRVSMKLRARIARARRPLPNQAPPADDADRLTCSELSSVLDEELERLPEKYRAPLILCYLQAKTRDEAAQELGWSASTLKGRLEWGRKLLGERLTRRGIALSAALLIAALGQTARAAVPASVVIAIVSSAGQLAAGKSLAASAMAPQVATLVQEFLHAILIKKLQIGAAACLLVVVLAGAGWFTHHALTADAGLAEPIPLAAAPVPQERPNPPVPSPDVKLVLPASKEPLPLDIPEPPIKKMSFLERGDQLINNVARCGNCHTPRNGKGVLDMSRHLQGWHQEFREKRGEPEREIETPDITASGRAGKWSEDRLINFFTKAKLASPHRLSAEDAPAVITYLRSLPGKKRESRRDD
jgi:RNA polymerase sigma factor (sigma-70 family)